MTQTEIKYIRKMQKVLQEIDNGVNVFFNQTQYKRLGLVDIKNKWHINAVGNKVVIGHTVNLTKKGRQYLNVIL